MKNSIFQLAVILIAFTGLFFLMSYTRIAAEEPKQYMILTHRADGLNDTRDFEKVVSQKLSEGWHLQGGVILTTGFSQERTFYSQALFK